MGDFKANAGTGSPSVIIVGAGVGGVATAARLAAAGCKVTVIEKNDFSGGRCSLIHRQEYVCKDPCWMKTKLTLRRDSTKAPVYFYFRGSFTRLLRISELRWIVKV
jgi:monoamine oxidase